MKKLKKKKKINQLIKKRRIKNKENKIKKK
jgi:hypothetical protein